MRPPEMTRAPTEMELRCAAALYGVVDAKMTPRQRTPWGQQTEGVRGRYVEQAGAVIRVMREPTEAMLDALAANWTAPNDGRRYPVTRHCFAVMIDAASPAIVKR